MNLMPPETLWLGNVGDVRDIRNVLNQGIVALVDLAVNEPIPTLPYEIVYCRFPLFDGEGNSPELIRSAIQTTCTLLREKIPTLVYCSADISRTPIIAAAVGLLRSVPAREVLTAWAESIPHDVSPTLWADVEAATIEL